MTKILVANQKGGVGKSLIADELAFSFARSGIPAAFIDLDGQGGTLHKTDQREDAKVVIVDTPGALQKQMGAWMREADVIIVPTKTTSRDIEPLLRMADIIRNNAPEKPVVYVLNGWNRWRASKDFKQWFSTQKKLRSVAVEILPQSEIYVRASAAGQSVVEFASRSSAAESMLKLVNAIRVLAGFEIEEGGHLRNAKMR